MAKKHNESLSQSINKLSKNSSQTQSHYRFMNSAYQQQQNVGNRYGNLISGKSYNQLQGMNQGIDQQDFEGAPN